MASAVDPVAGQAPGKVTAVPGKLVNIVLG